jgi:uncharacterized protein YegL
MAKKDYTHIVVILDKSGSMAGLTNDVIGGFNKFLKAQQELPGEATMSLIQFATYYYEEYTFTPIKEVPPLTRTSYEPDGCSTRLRDSLCKALISIEKELERFTEFSAPEKVVVVVITDGAENDSEEFDHKTMIAKSLECQEEKKWEFVYLGAHIDAFKQASDFGFKGAKSAMMSHGAQGMSTAFANTSDNIAAYRGGIKADMSYDASQANADFVIQGTQTGRVSSDEDEDK